MPAPYLDFPSPFDKKGFSGKKDTRDGSRSLDFWQEYAALVAESITLQIAAGTRIFTRSKDERNKLSSEERKKIQIVDRANAAALRFLYFANVIKQSEKDRTMVDVNYPPELRKWIIGGVAPAKELITMEKFNTMLRLADLIRYIENNHSNKHFVSRPMVHHLHLSAGSNSCSTALLFHRELIVNEAKKEVGLVNHYPGSLAVISPDPLLDEEAQYVLNEVKAKMALQVGQAPPAEFFTPDENNHLPPVYSWLTMPYMTPLSAAQLANFAPTVEAIAHPDTGLEIFASIHDDAKKNDWLDRIKTLLRLHQIAKERGWFDVNLTFTLIHHDGLQIQRNDAIWEIIDFHERKHYLTEPELLRWLADNHGKFTTASLLPIDCGCNAVFYARVPSATARRLRQAGSTAPPSTHRR